MSNSKPELTTTEVRQGNSRWTNLRVLIISLVAVAIAFTLAIWFFQANYDETDETIGGGTTLEEVRPEDGTPEENLENAPMPVPTEEVVPAPSAPAVLPPVTQ